MSGVCPPDTFSVCSTGDRTCVHLWVEDTDILVFEELGGVSWLDIHGRTWDWLWGQVGHSWWELLGFLALSKAWGFLCSLGC